MARAIESLDREDVPVATSRSYSSTRPRSLRHVDQLDADPPPLAAQPDAAIQDIADPELPSDLLGAERLVLEPNARDRARAEGAAPLPSAVVISSETPSLNGSLVKVAANILESQHGNRWQLGECRGRVIRR